MELIANEVTAGHHEKWDSSVYLRGLAGQEISLLARIFTIVGVFNALCSERLYKEVLPFNEVMNILRKGSERHFDQEFLETSCDIANGIYGTIVNTSEAEMKELMKNMVRRHFNL